MQDDPRTEINRTGLRATTSRVRVLALLRAAERPLSHLEVTEALAGLGFDRATLYRNLVDLTRAGLARRTELGDRVWRFEAAGAPHTSGWHPHFVCTTCGEVQCLSSRSLSLAVRGRSPRSLRRGEVEVHVRGLCDRCDAKEPE
jgi:Fur family transcriptional regulator, ferric uptake regulator